MGLSRLVMLSISLVLVVTVGGCARIPQASSPQYSTQLKMQAMHHWDLLAADLVDQVIPALPAAKVYLPPPPANSAPFQLGFHELMLTRFVNRGVVVLTADDLQTPVLEYKLQTLRHRADRGSQRPPPGLFTALTGGLMVMRDALEHGGHAGAVWKGVALSGAVAADVMWDALPAPTDHELLITSSIVQGGQYLFRRSDLYYINGADSWHYREHRQPQPKQIEITG